MLASPARLAAFGDAPALITRGGVVTYRALATRVTRAADGLGPVRRLVLVEGGNAVEPLVTYLAALAGGHVAMLAPPGEPVAALTAAYDPDAVFANGALTVRREGSVHDLHPDLALLLSTSGSTGSPKVVRLSRANVEANAESIATYLGIRPGDRAPTTLPMHYCYGLSVVHSHLLRGAALLLTDLSVVDPCFWDLVRAHGGTSLAGVPYTFDLLDRVGFMDMHLPTLRYVTQAGGRLAPERVRDYARRGRARGWDLYVMYGQTEATARMAYLPPRLAESHPDYVGVPVPGGSFAIEDGELVYSGPNVMLGYAHGPADLALGRTVTRLRTGDLAREVGGLYQVTGRRSRFVKAFGLRIDLERVEARLAARGVVAGCADADDLLLVAVEGRYDLDALRHDVAASCGLPPRAVAVRAVASLPRLCGGKVDYAAIRALVPATLPASGARDLRAAYAEVLERRDVGDGDTFVGLGGDSLSYVELSVRVEEALGHLPPAWHVTPIGALAAAPRRRRRWTRSVETSVVLRALAIVLVVASHANLVDVVGGAHALLAVAGFNFARFHLAGTDRLARVRHAARSVGRVAFPAVAWTGAVALAGGGYSLANVLLLNGLAGPRTLGPAWRLWFLEALVYMLVAVTALLAIPRVHRLERRFPFAVALAVTGAGLALRALPVAPSIRLNAAYTVFWLFALGWAAAKASSRARRLAVSAVAVAAVPTFFGTTTRSAIVAGGVLLLAWVAHVPWPAPLVRATGALASASLYVYLVHWQVFPHLQWRSPLLATVASFAAGLAYWRAVTTLLPMLRRARLGVRAAAPALSG